MVNEQKNARSQKELATAIKNDSDRFDSPSTKLSQSGHRDRVTEEIHAPSKNRGGIDTVQESSKKIMPDVYKKWIHLFREKKSAKVLLKHKP